MPDRPLRVVRIIARLNIGGPARHVALLQRHLPARGYRSTLVTGVVGPGEAELSLSDAAGAPLERVVVPELGRAVRAADDLVALRRIHRCLGELEPDIVHTHTAKAGALGRLAAAAHNAVRPAARRAVVVHTFHGHVFEGYFGSAVSGAIRLTERSLARATDRIVAISPAVSHDLIETFRIAPTSKVAVVPLGLDLDRLAQSPLGTPRLRRAAGFPDEAVVIGYVGRLVPIKHVDLLIRAFARLSAAAPQSRLLIVGDGECRPDLERLVAEARLTGVVQFAGWSTDLSDVYGAMDIVALSSRNEGTPVALIEAGAAGKPVVATAVGGVVDVVVEGRTGFLVPSEAEDRLSAALLDLVTHPGRRDAFGQAARAAVLGRFGYARLVADLDGLYRTALIARRGPAGDRPVA